MGSGIEDCEWLVVLVTLHVLCGNEFGAWTITRFLGGTGWWVCYHYHAIGLLEGSEYSAVL